MAKSRPLEQARRWWKEHADAHRYVVSPDEAPSASVARELREEGLVFDVAGRLAWILTTAKPADGLAVFLANYWAVVAMALKRYTPAAAAPARSGGGPCNRDRAGSRRSPRAVARRQEAAASHPQASRGIGRRCVLPRRRAPGQR